MTSFHGYLKRAILSFLGIFLAQELWASEQSFRVCYEDRSHPPFVLGGDDQVPEREPGIFPEMISASLAPLNVSTDFIRRPWKRCLALLKDNEVDAVFPAIYQKEREALGQYPLDVAKGEGNPDIDRRLLRVSYMLFAREDTLLKWDGKAFNNVGMSIGAPLGYVVVKRLREDFGLEANTVHSPEKGLSLVAEKHLSAYIIERNIGRKLLEKIGRNDELVELEPAFAEYDWYMMISHKFYSENKGLSENIWDEIARYRRDLIERKFEIPLSN
ncbi:hypothetical protein [Kiloniella laminariae]|uniref:hypothetical protein n=1 Tax=Kiloniella laminariae TaxID=454162 RepID=UPI00036412B2|nr:hypothetical protein [Kiloniella laminariae]